MSHYINDFLWYGYQGAINVPRVFAPEASTFFRVERISPNDNYMTFNKDSTTLFTEDN
jgi:hypothetical protein